jgi:hypothetical protein
MAISPGNPPGVILYEGPSQIDGEPIVAIGSPFNKESQNKKTGDMLQAYILRSDVSPTRAINEGLDESICGDCRAKGVIKNRRNVQRWCYVAVRSSALSMYGAYRRGRYERLGPPHYRRLAERPVRLTAYGDPAAVPYEIWEELLGRAPGHTGYTHFWRDAGERLRSICMASVESLEQAREARARGWRFFLVSANFVKGQERAVFRCPASDGRKTCAQCLACNGAGQNARRASVVISPHGGPAVESNFRKMYGA